MRPHATQRTSTAPVGRQARIAVADAHIERGIAYDHLGQHERAIGDGDAAICLKPHYAKAYYNRSLAYLKLGRRKESERNFQKAKELGYEAL